MSLGALLQPSGESFRLGLLGIARFERRGRELRPFKNSARKDGLELKHWVKASDDVAAGELVSRKAEHRSSNLSFRLSFHEVQHREPSLCLLPGRVYEIS